MARSRSRPLGEEAGWTLFAMPNGTMLDLFEPDSAMIPTCGFDGRVYGINERK